MKFSHSEDFTENFIKNLVISNNNYAKQLKSNSITLYLIKVYISYRNKSVIIH